MTPVRTLGATDPGALATVLSRFGLELQAVPPGEPIPGSWWGDSEAGLKDDVLYARADTPVHSVLHEACHFVCMSPGRRSALDTDAGGDYDEENAVCYLQIVLADLIPGMGRARMYRDMDTWGYSFRLGSARAWFETDADDARQWLVSRGILDAGGSPTFRCRGSGSPCLA